MNKIALLFVLLFWNCQAVVISYGKLPGHSFKVLVDKLSDSKKIAKFGFQTSSFKRNLEVGELELYTDDHVQYHKVEDLQILFGYFLLKVDSMRKEVEDKIDSIFKSEVQKLAKQFITFNESSDVLKNEPEVYYDKELTDIKWDKENYPRLLSNIRRVGWLFEARTTGTISRDNKTLLNFAYRVFDMSIDSLIKRANDDAKADKMEDAAQAARLLQELKATFGNEKQNLLKDEEVDWEDFEPFLRFSMEEARTGYKKVRQNVMEHYQTANTDNSIGTQFSSLWPLNHIFFLYSSNDLSPEFVSSADQIAKETLQEILNGWIVLIERFQHETETDKKLRLNIDSAFITFLLSAIRGNLSQEVKKSFYGKLLEKAETIRSRLKDLKPKTGGKFMETFDQIIDKKAFAFATLAIVDYMPLKYDTYSFLLSFLASGITADEFLASAKSDKIKYYFRLFSGLLFIKDDVLNTLGSLANLWARSQFLLSDEEISQSFLFWSAKYCVEIDNGKVEAHDKTDNLVEYLERQIIPIKMTSFHLTLRFLQMIIFIEDDSLSTCDKLPLDSEKVATAMTEFLKREQFSQITKCLSFIEPGNLMIDSKINQSGRFDIKVKANQPIAKGSRLKLIIELEGDKETVTGSQFSSNDSSAEDFVRVLRETKSLCKPQSFNPQSCYADKHRPIMI